jgi:hypothetical protein
MKVHIHKRALAFAAREATTVSEALARRLPVSIGVTNELVMTLKDELGRAYRGGLLKVAYVLAHDCDPGLLSPEELIDELRLNENAVHHILGASAPERRVVLLDSPIDQLAVRALEEHGIDAVILPLSPREPCRLGERLVWLSLGDEADEVVSLDELQREIAPPWLSRIDPVAVPLDERRGARLSALLGWLLEALGFDRAPRLPPTALFDQQYRLEKLPARVAVPLLFRLARNRRGIVMTAARELVERLAIEVELGARPEPPAELPEWAHSALPDPAIYHSLRENGWRGRERWLAFMNCLRYGELADNCMMRSMAVL